MKHLGHIIFATVLVIFTASCSSIPNKSVFESLDTKELAKAIKSDELFESNSSVIFIKVKQRLEGRRIKVL